MKALVLCSPGRFEVVDDYKKPVVKPGWALIKVMYAGICGSDLPRFAVTGSYHHPMILGHEFMGVVHTPSPDSQKYNGGEKVAVLPLIPCQQCASCRQNEPFHCENYQFLGSRNDGGFAEYCLVPEKNLFLIPDNIDPRGGAFIEPLAVALHVVRRSGFKEGQNALVFGAGPIGLLIALWLKVLGACEVAVADIRPESLKIARQAGFKNVVNPTDDSFASLGKFDTVFEAAGSSKALLSAIDKVNRKGAVTIVGRDTGNTVIPLKIFEQLMRKEITINGCWGYNLTGDESFLREILEQDSFNVAPLITQEIALDDSVKIIQKMIDRSIYYCKVLLKV